MSGKYISREEVLKIVELWNTNSYEQIANILNRPISTIKKIEKNLREEGLQLPRKLMSKKNKKEFFTDIAMSLANSKMRVVK